MIDEIIGKHVKVVKASAPEYMCEGKAVDETKNTIHIQTTDGIKKIPKKACTFDISGRIVVGKDIMYDPVMRVKKLWRRTRR